MTTIKNLLQQSSQQLKTFSATPQLDAEILLAAVMNVSKTYLHTYSEEKISADQQTKFFKQIARYCNGEPLAYVLQQWSFWSLTLEINSHVLIPRAETELLVEIILQQLPATEKLRIADLGTGSGAIALALASERANWNIFATDIQNNALTVAKHNAQRLNLSNVNFNLGSWCAALSQEKFHAIVSNPPYIAESDLHLNNLWLQHEPRNALVAGEDGLAALRVIVKEAPYYLLPGGLLALEHGFDQGRAVRELLQQAGYDEVKTFVDLGGNERVTIGKILNPS